MLSKYMKCDVGDLLSVDHKGISWTAKFIKADICSAVMVLWIFTESNNLALQISCYGIKILHITIYNDFSVFRSLCCKCVE